jgi:subfamily B ATP-binding cassette protein HlyB/CyaB
VRLEHEQVLWLLGSLCGLNRIPFDPKLVLQNFPPPHTEATLFEAARRLGFRLGSARLDMHLLRKLPAACIAFIKPGDGSSQAARMALLLRSDDERLLYFEAGSTRPQSITLAQAETLFEARCFLAAVAGEAGQVADAEFVPPDSFGFRWFARELLRHKAVWRYVLAASLSIQLIGLATPLFTQIIIDKVVIHQTQSTLAVIAVAMVMFALFCAGMSWLRQYYINHTGNRVDSVLGSEVFCHLLSLFLPYFEQRPTGTLVARLHAVETIREFIAGAAVSLLLDLPFLAVFLAAMFWFSWQLALISVGILALIMAAGFLVTPMLRVRLNQQFQLGARNQAFLTEHIAGIETVKALQMEPRLAARYDEYLAAYLLAGFGTRQLSNSYTVVVNTLEQVMTLSILCVGALLVMRNDGFTVGMLVAFQMFASRMSQPMLRLAGLWQEFQQASIAVKRLGDIMNAPAEPLALVPSRTSSSSSRIEIDKLAFRHSESSPYLYEGLDLVLEPDKLTVLTGPSGCGKSTLAKLLLGLYQPSAGRILIDGRDIRHFAANELRRYFGVVPQDTWLFAGSLYDNLVAGSPQAGFDEVVKACKLAEIHDAIERLPQGYHTTVGERGVGLSGGQKQRVAIARALLKQPNILIFDEATSSLDAYTAAQVAATINRLKKGITVLFIAHQLPDGLEADQVAKLTE